MMRKNGTPLLEVEDNTMAPKIQTIEEITEEEVAVVEAITVVDIRETVRRESQDLIRTETQFQTKEESSTEKEVEEKEAVAAEEEVAVVDITKTVREDHTMA